jgi:hypothetical protein
LSLIIDCTCIWRSLWRNGGNTVWIDITGIVGDSPQLKLKFWAPQPLRRLDLSFGHRDLVKSVGRTPKYEYPPPPPINVLATALLIGYKHLTNNRFRSVLYTEYLCEIQAEWMKINDLICYKCVDGIITCCTAITDYPV